MYCQNCGTELNLEYKHCNNCGTEIVKPNSFPSKRISITVGVLGILILLNTIISPLIIKMIWKLQGYGVGQSVFYLINSTIVATIPLILSSVATQKGWRIALIVLGILNILIVLISQIVSIAQKSWWY